MNTLLEAAGPALFFIVLLGFAAIWHTLQNRKASKPGLYDQERDGFSGPKDCHDCGAPGPYPQHPGICWGCIQERDQLRNENA